GGTGYGYITVYRPDHPQPTDRKQITRLDRCIDDPAPPVQHLTVQHLTSPSDAGHPIAQNAPALAPAAVPAPPNCGRAKTPAPLACLAPRRRPRQHPAPCALPTSASSTSAAAADTAIVEADPTIIAAGVAVAAISSPSSRCASAAKPSTWPSSHN